MDKTRKDRESERKKRLVESRKAKKTCIACGKQDERTLRGTCRCAECYEKNKKYKKKSNQKNKEKTKEKSAEYRKRHKELCRKEHRCIDCGKQDERTLLGYAVCNLCQKKRSDKQRESRKTLRENKEAVKARKSYHIAKLFAYPLISAAYYHGEEIDIETYTKLLKKARRKEKRENGHEGSNETVIGAA